MSVAAPRIFKRSFMGSASAAHGVGAAYGFQVAWAGAVEAKAPHALRTSLRRQMRYWAKCAVADVRRELGYRNGWEARF